MIPALKYDKQQQMPDVRSHQFQFFVLVSGYQHVANVIFWALEFEIFD